MSPHRPSHDRTAPSSFALLAAPALAAALLLGACSDSSPQASASAPAPTVTPELPTFPAASGEVVLTVSGAIHNINDGAGLELDLDLLAMLPQVQGTVRDPWVEADVDFVGFRLADLLAAAGVESGARIEIVALDLYTVAFDLADLDDSVVIATGQGDGSVIPVSDGGPTRLIVTDSGSALADPNNWVWSIDTITVR